MIGQLFQKNGWSPVYLHSFRAFIRGYKVACSQLITHDKISHLKLHHHLQMVEGMYCATVILTKLTGGHCGVLVIKPDV